MKKLLTGALCALSATVPFASSAAAPARQVAAAGASRPSRRLVLLLAASAALLTSLAGGQPADAAYPGANGKIVWVGADAGDDDGIWVMNADGSGKTRLLGQADDAYPVWSPDGRKIAFSRGGSLPSGCTYGEIYVMNADGSGLTAITGDSTATEVDPTWSPDGEKIAYTRYSQNDQCELADWGIWVMNADGSVQTPLTSGGSTTMDSQPAWSPDGQKIAFTSTREAFDEIFTMNPDGSQVTRLTNTQFPNNGATFSSSPAWSPDGQRIAYERIDFLNTNREIWVMEADGSGETAVTQNGFVANIEPAWSPDGQKILFSGLGSFCESCDNEIFSVDVDGTGQTQLTDNTVLDRMPDWQPLPVSEDVVVTDCADPELAALTVVAGDLVVESVAGCDAISFPSLVEVGGDVTITDTSATVISMGNLASAGSVTIDGNTAAAQIDLGSLTTVDGAISMGNNTAAAEVSLDAVTTVGGAVALQDNTSAGEVDLSSLTTAGEVTITGNTSAAVVDVSSADAVEGDVTITDNGTASVAMSPDMDVAGDVTIETTDDGTVSMGTGDVAGDVTLTGIGATTVSATTGGGATEVALLGGTAAMRVLLPDGTFEQPVAFTIERQADGAAEEGTSADGAPAAIDPLAGYRFTFAVPTLNQQAQLSFTVDLAQLDAETRAALLAGVAGGSATLVVKGDEAGAAYQAFERCTETQTPETDGCVALVPLDLAGGTAAPGAEPAFVRFDGIAGGFSTWAVALVEPQDSTPPVITPTLGGTLGGAGFYTSDVAVSWTVEDRESAITQQSGCDSQTVSADTAGVIFTCEATSAGGTASESVTIKRDATPPSCSASASPDRLWPPDHKLVTVDVSVAVSDALSGVAGYTLLSVTSSEPDDGEDDGRTVNDIQGFDPGTPDTSGSLRAERSGVGSGRIYTLTYQATDLAGNPATCSAQVTVPLD